MFKFIKLNSNPIKYYLTVGVALALFFGFMQWVGGDRFSDPDAFYHARVAQLLWDGQISSFFQWLPFTTWGTGYADQHYLYHLLLYPFSDIHVLKWSIVIFSTAAFVGFIYLLRTLKVKYAPAWLTFLLVSSVDFLFRVDQVKANTLSLLLLFGAIALLVKKRYNWLFPLSFVFVWVYGGFVFLPIIIGIFVLFDRLESKMWNWRPLLMCIGGISLGILLHPHFPNILTQLYNQIFRAGLGFKHGVYVGQEWYPYTLQGFLQSNAFLAGLWLFGIAIHFRDIYRQKSLSGLTLKTALFLCSLLFFALTLKSRRFIEYWSPFAILFTAVALNSYLRQITFERVKTTLRSYWEFGFAVLLLLIVVSSLAYINVSKGVGYFKNGTPAESLKGAASFLADKAVPGKVVFNSQWDEFPQLFYWDPNHQYIIGMDPMFMYIQDPDRYWNWRKVSEDKPLVFNNDQELHDLLVKDFQASYLFLQNSRNPKLKDYVEGTADGFLKVYSDVTSSVYRVE